jgi:short-subunit dehydrogenase
MKNGFRGKHVVVTGGSAGLGLAIAGAFLDVGAHVSLLARDEQRLREARLALGERAQWTAAITADVTNQEQVERAFADARKFHGPIHVLVNAAGISDRGAIVGTATTRFQELWEINFLGPVRCVNAAADDLVETRGHIVNIGSLASKVASGYLGAYPSSKFALAAYTQQLRIELVPRGVHALLVCPGPIQRADAGRRYDDRAAQLPESARRPAARPSRIGRAGQGALAGSGCSILSGMGRPTDSAENGHVKPAPATCSRQRDLAVCRVAKAQAAASRKHHAVGRTRQ